MYDRMLLAVDGSQASQAAVEVAIGVATKMGADVEVVHVREHEVSKWNSPSDLERPDDAAALLDGVVEQLRNAKLTAHGTLRRAAANEVAAEVVSVADEVGADMIVVGSRGLSAVPRMLLGSVSNRIVHISRRPVLVTHPSGDTAE